MEVEALPDAAAFLAATQQLRTQEPILTNVVGSIAQGAIAGRTYESALWLVVRDNGTVVGCAARTAPFKAVLSPMPVTGARAVGRWLRKRGPQLPGLTGPQEAVDGAAAGLRRDVDVRMRELARELVELRPAQPDRPIAGRAVRAQGAELDLLVQWLAAFEVEAGLQRFASREHTAALVDWGQLWVWRVHGESVALAGHAPLVTTPGGIVGRIGPVYTPPEHRRHGYGSAVTRAVTQELATRCDRIMLFADAANRDSNSIYEAMGFVVVGQIVEAELRDVRTGGR